MLARTNSCTLLGLDVLPVAVEVNAQHGLPTLAIIGLPDQAVRESRERVRTAILNSQFELPSTKYIVNLAPADVKKEGGAFDLAIALGLLAASGQIDPEALAAVTVLGELALDGSVRPIHGVLPMAMAMRRQKRRLLVPAGNAAEAAVVPDLDLAPVTTLRHAVECLSGAAVPFAIPKSRHTARREALPPVDFAEVKGQAHIKRAFEVAAAGHHHLLLIGPPGSGKTMLAQRLPTIQQELSREEAIEASAIHSIAGLLEGRPLLEARPFRAPHHTSSAIALIGGGSIPKPGEASLAHHGVLFLDELAEFHRDALEGLRQPMEEGRVRVARIRRSLTFPARFMLVAAMNPCPDGFLTDPHHQCRCTPLQVQRYRNKVSGPLLDRIDLHVDVPAVSVDALTHQTADGETSAQIRARVLQAQGWRRKRGQKRANAQLSAKELKTFCQPNAEGLKLLRSAMQSLHLSARSYTKVLKVSRTIADLAASDSILPAHIAEAIQYRSLDRPLGA